MVGSQFAGYECTFLESFKVFLKEINANSKIIVDEDSNCVTRVNSVTYPINTIDELKSEVIMYTWQQLKLKQCPEHFIIGLMKFIIDNIYKDLNIANQTQNDCHNINSVPKQCDAYGEYALKDLLKLQKFLNQRIPNIILSLLTNSENSNLHLYADCMRHLYDKCSGRAVFKLYADAGIKNKSRKMEDRHICLPRFSEMLNLPKVYDFYGVFDGHSGPLAATYAANNLPFMLSQILRSEDESKDYYRKAFEKAFLMANKKFSDNSLSSGTTAVCALLKYDSNRAKYEHLYIAWVGDSCALLASPLSNIQLVNPHKPDEADERKRIESLETAGTVVFVQGQWRVNGLINVSRSIGDYAFEAVIAQPDFRDIPIESSHDFLLLGTDGLWDYVGENHMVQFIYNSLLDDKQSFEDIPKQLIDLAKENGSHDNITVIIVLLKERRQVVQSYKNYTNNCKLENNER